MGEINTHPRNERRPDLNRQQVIVTRGRFVAQLGLDDRENHVALLPFPDGGAERAYELAAGGFEHVQIMRMIDVIAECAFGVGDTVLIPERNGHAGSVRARAKSSTLKNRLARSGSRQTAANIGEMRLSAEEPLRRIQG